MYEYVLAEFEKSYICIEFMHHYDYYYLRLPASVHCKGFEARIRDLRKKLAS